MHFRRKCHEQVDEFIGLYLMAIFYAMKSRFVETANNLQFLNMPNCEFEFMKAETSPRSK